MLAIDCIWKKNWVYRNKQYINGIPPIRLEKSDYIWSYLLFLKQLNINDDLGMSSNHLHEEWQQWPPARGGRWHRSWAIRLEAFVKQWRGSTERSGGQVGSTVPRVEEGNGTERPGSGPPDERGGGGITKQAEGNSGEELFWGSLALWAKRA